MVAEVGTSPEGMRKWLQAIWKQLTMSSSTSSHCVPSSFSRKLFLWLLPATVTLFTTIHQSPFAVASPFIPQKDDSVVVPMTSFGQPLPPSPLSLVPNPPLYFVFPENLPLERPFDEQNDGSEEELAEEAMGTKAKRAQTFVRFGKRAQTFVRFGKRAQTFVRLGRDTQRQFDGKMQSEQQQKKA
uniref:Uncharacterized protein n=1 Tax=Globodera rostochiensis TaxID=31243 RepID=A0A914HQF1_GLORO